MSLATEKTRCPALPSASPMAIELVGRGRRPGRQLAVLGPVQDGARRRRADGPGVHGLAHDGRHLGDLLARRRVVGPALAEHVGPQRAVGDEGGHVEDAGRPLHLVEVLAEGLPVPVHALGQRGARDVLHALHQLNEPVAVGRARRGEADAAVAHHDGGHAVPARGRDLGVPGGLAVVVGVDVDPARRDEQPVGVDDAARRSLDLAHGGDDAAVDGDVGGAGRPPRSVGDGAAADDQVVHVCSSRGRSAGRSARSATPSFAAFRSWRPDRGRRASRSGG